MGSCGRTKNTVTRALCRITLDISYILCFSKSSGVEFADSWSFVYQEQRRISTNSCILGVGA